MSLAILTLTGMMQSLYSCHRYKNTDMPLARRNELTQPKLFFISLLQTKQNSCIISRKKSILESSPTGVTEPLQDSCCRTRRDCKISNNCWTSHIAKYRKRVIWKKDLGGGKIRISNKSRNSRKLKVILKIQRNILKERHFLVTVKTESYP